jgi:hypothetical protein
LLWLAGALGILGLADIGAVNLASFAATPAYAACTGMVMQADGNFEYDPTLCPRGPNGSPAVRAVPQIWTAIAISKGNLRNATSWNARSQAAAEKAALARCGTVRPDCFIVISRANKCISLAISMNFAWGTGEDSLSSIGSDNLAVSRCTAAGGTKCFVTAHPCQDDGPVDRQYTSLAP